MIEFLAMLDRIRPLSDRLREHLSGIMTERSIRRNEFLVKASVINSHVFFIKEGIVRCYYLKESGSYRPSREVSLCFFMENDIIASTWSFAAQKPGREYMVALEDCSIGMIRIPAKYLASYLGINAVTLSRIKRVTPSYKPPRPS